MTRHRTCRAIAAIVLACVVLCWDVADRAGAAQTIVAIRGFTPPHAAAELALERRLEAFPDAAHAEANLRHLTSEPHPAGTDASRRTAEWLRDQFRGFGLDAQIVTYNAYLPIPREAHLDLVAPEKIALASPEPPLDVDRNPADDHLAPAVNAYSASGDVTAPVIFVNYGMPADYRSLDSLGISVKGKLVLARYGRGYRGVKARLAEERGAAGLLLFSDPADDGFASGDVFPDGPWRPLQSVQRGSILYTQLYPGDPLAPQASPAHRVDPASASSLPRIPSLAISGQDAAVILSHLGRARVPAGWQGGLPLTYHLGPGEARVHLRVVVDFAERPIYDVIARLQGADDGQWVILGNHHDAWVYGAADPGSGTTAMLEMARSLGELAHSGWTPRRTILICEWDAEEPGLIGSTDWVEANRAELQAKAVAYINTDVGVTGPNFFASAVPSLKDFIREAAREVTDPQTGQSVYGAWSGHAAPARGALLNLSAGDSANRPPAVAALGAGSDFSPFLDFAGVPSLDLSFSGDYGVYHSLYDDFYWMQHFGDPGFSYEVALSQLLAVMALRLSEADIEPFDYTAYSSEIARAEDDLFSRAATQDAVRPLLKRAADATGEFSQAALRAQDALSSFSYDPAREAAINRDLEQVEQALLDPAGLAGRPWYKHTVFAPGVNSGYAPEILPGLNDALDRRDPAALDRASAALAAALHRAAARLNAAAQLAGAPALSPQLGN